MNTRASDTGPLSRRRLLAAGVLALAVGRHGVARAHESAGPVTPRQAAPTGMRLNTIDGKPALLPDLLKGRITAVQLMFTGCSATCPIQGAIFADAQAHLAPADKQLRLLSISIDPLGDDAPALARWLGRFGAQPARWSAAVPAVRDVDPLLDFLRGRATGADRHTAQAYLFDRQGRLAFRTVDMPPGNELVRLMQALSAAG
jgi:protein SCO1